MRDEERGGGIPSPGSWSVVTWLLVLNAAYFLIDHVAFGAGDPPHYGAVSRDAVLSGHVYLLVTYMFVHGSLIHLAFNMILLWFAGKALLQLIGKHLFLFVYFGGGILGAVLQLVFFPDNHLLGASAGCIAVLIAFATILPKQEVYLMVMFILPVRLKLRTIAFLVVGIDILAMILGWNPEIGHLAHLGGAFFGWAFISFIFPKLKARADNHERQDHWQERFGARQIVDAEVVDDKGRGGSEKKKAAFVSEDVDAILDKISEKGMQSLTAKERKILEKSSEKLSRRVDRG